MGEHKDHNGSFDFIRDVLSQMQPISLEEMNAVKLMNRTDTKYLTNRQTLQEMARHWEPLFYVQDINGLRQAHYTTLYFDTPDALTYTIHHNQRLHRQKIRQRHYLDTGTRFLEVKNKINTGRTKKKRIEIPESAWGDLYRTPETTEFLRQKVWITEQPLAPRLQNYFQRVTLVNKNRTERITIDSGIRFHNHLSQQDADVSDLVIVEVKQDGNQRSDFKDLLLNARVPQRGLSKYCLGMLLTDEQIKYNRFKDKIRYVGKLIGQPLQICSEKNNHQ
ncbi:MAG: polyphosphate polymerase domain-containing protein [Bacteroidales bacterium]|nr:polyphosphate polymerase domain-containing protein [Bacteroidales bacterium]